MITWRARVYKPFNSYTEQNEVSPEHARPGLYLQADNEDQPDQSVRRFNGRGAAG
jgi:hypothetical protein